MINKIPKNIMRNLVYGIIFTMFLLIARADDAKPLSPSCKGDPEIIYCYPSNAIRDQGAVATVIVESGLTLRFYEKDAEIERHYSGKKKAAAWSFMDIPPGIYKLSATFAKGDKSSKEPIEQIVQVKPNCIYYASYKTSMGIKFNYMQLKKSTWKLGFTDNIVDAARNSVAAAREHDIKNIAARAEKQRDDLEKVKAGQHGALFDTVAVPAGLDETEVADCVDGAMKARKIDRVPDTGDTVVGQFPQNEEMVYICIKRAPGVLELYNVSFSKHNAKAFKKVLFRQLANKAKAKGEK